MLQTSEGSRISPEGQFVCVHQKMYTTPTTDPLAVTKVYTVPSYQTDYGRIRSDNKGGRGKWKDCQHYKRWALPRTTGLFFPFGHQYLGFSSRPFLGTCAEPIILYKWTAQNPATGFGLVWDPSEGLPLWLVGDGTENFISPPPSLSTLKQTSIGAMMPLIRSELSLINSLIELKDFASLPQTLLSVQKFYNLIRTSTGALRKLLTSKQKAVRIASDVYLQTKFNILPLLSDIRGIRTALSRTERRINDLIAREGRVRTKHFTCSVVEPSNVSIPWTAKSGYNPNYGQFADWVLNANIKCWRQVIVEPAIFHAEMRYNYNYTAYQREHARVLALLDAFGINLDPSIIWNAIPWSFVIDWLIGVSRYLSTFKTTNMEPKINILSYLWSIKRVRHIDLAIQQYSVKWNNVIPSIGWLPLPRVSYSAYRRETGIPSSSSITLSGLSLNEFSLGAALVLSKRRRRRKT